MIRHAAVLALLAAFPAAAVACPPDGRRDETGGLAAFQSHRNRYVLASSALDGRIYNELSPGLRIGTLARVGIDAITGSGVESNGSLVASGDVRIGTGLWLAQVAVDRHEYTHLANAQRSPPGFCPGAADPGCVTLIGAPAFATASAGGQGYVPTFAAAEQNTEIRAARQIGCSPFFAGIGYLRRSVSYLQYPVQRGVGIGVERDVSLQRRFSTYAGLWYYPAVDGTYTVPQAVAGLGGRRFNVAYEVLRYRAGAIYRVGWTRLIVSGGIEGARGTAHADAPGSFLDHRYVVGLGATL